MAEPITGNNIQLYKYDSVLEEDILVACARTCDLSIEVDERITTSLQSAFYEESKPNIARWQINVGGLIILQDYSYLYLLNMQKNRELNTFKFVIDNGTVEGLVIVSGVAWLKNLRLSGNNKEIATYDCTLKGSGGYSLAGTQIVPGGYVITGTTISVLQWAADVETNSHVFTDGIGRTMLYGSRGGQTMMPITYTGSAPSGGQAADWQISTGTLRVSTDVPFVPTENVIILVQ